MSESHTMEYLYKPAIDGILAYSAASYFEPGTSIVVPMLNTQLPFNWTAAGVAVVVCYMQSLAGDYVFPAISPNERMTQSMESALFEVGTGWAAATLLLNALSPQAYSEIGAFNTLAVSAGITFTSDWVYRNFVVGRV